MVALFVCVTALLQPVPPFEADIEKFEAADRINPPKPGGILFIGSSSIVRWTTLSTGFPGYNVINRGFGGSSISDSVRYADRIATPYKPKFIVFFAGTNDINDGKSAETVFHDYQAFVGEVRAKLPGERILFISITPAPSRQAKWPVMKEANRLIHDFCSHDKNLLYLDEWNQFLTPEQGPRPELFVQDQLHMNPSGYAIWVKDLKPIVDREITVGRKLLIRRVDITNDAADEKNCPNHDHHPAGQGRVATMYVLVFQEEVLPDNPVPQAVIDVCQTKERDAAAYRTRHSSRFSHRHLRH